MVVTSSRDKESSTTTVSVHRWRSLEAATAMWSVETILALNMRRY